MEVAGNSSGGSSTLVTTDLSSRSECAGTTALKVAVVRGTDSVSSAAKLGVGVDSNGTAASLGGSGNAEVSAIRAALLGGREESTRTAASEIVNGLARSRGEEGGTTADSVLGVEASASTAAVGGGIIGSSGGGETSSAADLSVGVEGGEATALISGGSGVGSRQSASVHLESVHSPVSLGDDAASISCSVVRASGTAGATISKSVGNSNTRAAKIHGSVEGASTTASSGGSRVDGSITTL